MPCYAYNCSYFASMPFCMKLCFFTVCLFQNVCRITDAMNETKDKVRYLESLKRHLDQLYTGKFYISTMSFNHHHIAHCILFHIFEYLD